MSALIRLAPFVLALIVVACAAPSLSASVPGTGTLALTLKRQASR